MKTLWKEWRQQRGLVALGICAGILWPLIEMAINYSIRKVWFTNWGSGIVAGGGAIFAIFLAIATGYADLRPGIDTFWQTRPVRVGRIFLVKLVMGMFLLAMVFAVIMVPDLWTGLLDASNLPGFVWTVFWTTWPIAVLVFGAGLFFMALIRDMAKAAFVTIWFGLLVYFLPLFFNALRPLSVFERFNTPYQDREFFRGLVSTLHAAWSQGFFTLIRYLGDILLRTDFIPLGIYIGGALAFTLLAVQAVKRNWRWQPGQKTIVWTLGASAALIFAITLFQVRSDLQPATHKDGHTLVNPMPLDWVEPPLPQAVKDRGNKLFKSSDSGRIEHEGYLYLLSLAYESDLDLGYKEWNKPVYRHLVLHVYRPPFNGDSSPFCRGGIVIASTTEMERRSRGRPIHSYIRGDRMYVATWVAESKTCVATLDVSNPEQPRLIGALEIPGLSDYGMSFTGHGDRAYLFGNNRCTILSLKEPDRPVVAAQWPFDPRNKEACPPLPRHISELASLHLPYGLDSQVVGNRLLCTDGVALAMFDLSEPNDPMLIYHENIRVADQIQKRIVTDRKDPWRAYEAFDTSNIITAVAMNKDCLYLATQRGLIVRRLVRHADGHWSGERIGYRAATPLERLSGRAPMALLFWKGYLVESSGNFGLLVYDVSAPARPRRVLHSDLYSRGLGIWEGILYSMGYGNQLNLFDLPDKAH